MRKDPFLDYAGMLRSSKTKTTPIITDPNNDPDNTKHRQEEAKISTVDTSVPLTEKLELSPLFWDASMICLTVSGSSVWAPRVCAHGRVNPGKPSMRFGRPKVRGVRSDY